MSDLPTTFTNETDSNRFGWCELVRVDFPSLLVAMTSHERDVTYDSVAFKPDGRLGTIEKLRQSEELKPARTTLRLTGLDNAILDQLMTEYPLWSRVRIWWAVLNLDTYDVIETVMADDLQAGRGRVRFDAESGQVEMSVEPMSAQLGREAMIAASPETQAQRYSGDTIFNDVAKIPGREIRWGRGIYALSGGTNPFDGSRRRRQVRRV